MKRSLLLLFAFGILWAAMPIRSATAAEISLAYICDMYDARREAAYLEDPALEELCDPKQQFRLYRQDQDVAQKMSLGPEWRECCPSCLCYMSQQGFRQYDLGIVWPKGDSGIYGVEVPKDSNQLPANENRMSSLLVGELRSAQLGLGSPSR